MRRAALKYHTISEREYRDLATRLREGIARLRVTDADRVLRSEGTDRLFELLRLSTIAASSREVEEWRGAPSSMERTAVALNWAGAAAGEAEYFATLHGLWRRDSELGRKTHHITYDEVPPFPMPAGWTPEDVLDHRDGRIRPSPDNTEEGNDSGREGR